MSSLKKSIRKPWPEAVSDGLILPCLDCGAVPRFDYRVADYFWQKYTSADEQRDVLCLPCLDVRCAGLGLANALEEVQWTGTFHTVVLRPLKRVLYSAVSLVARDVTE